MEKLTTLVMDVPHKRSGGVIHQRPMRIDRYKLEDRYSLRPCLLGYERRVANLPEELRFVVENKKPVTLRGKMATIM